MLVDQGSTLEQAAREVGCSTRTLRRRGVASSHRVPSTVAVPPLGGSLTDSGGSRLRGLLDDPTTEGVRASTRRDAAEGVASAEMGAVMRATAEEILAEAPRGRVVPERLKHAAEEILAETPARFGGTAGLSCAEMDEVVRLSVEHLLDPAVEARIEKTRNADTGEDGPGRRFVLKYGVIPQWRSVR